MAITSSAPLTLRPISFSPPPSSSSSSLSLSPFWVFSLPKKRASKSLMVSALNNPFIPGFNPSEFSPISQNERDYLPLANVVASSSLTHERTSLQAEIIIEKNERDEPKMAVTYPPDWDSKLLFGRVIFVDMPLVSIISEQIIAQLLYLQGMNPTEPIYMYFYSHGTHNDEGDAVGLESDGFAIYDTMMSLTNEIRTLLIGTAVGHAVLLVAAGKKGKRYMLPHALAKIQEPRMPAFGEMQASDLVVRAREALIQKNKFMELLGKHTGNSVEKITKMMKTRFCMNFSKAKEFGVVDKIYDHEKDRMMADVPTMEELKQRRKTIQN
ncbi:hypothetical protein LUZ60_013952 [Juncus effusus]|nr:hypothetical protein LUZ60_013952 [Juncus effusus]